MRIKKHKSGNQYIRAGDIWIRDFTKECKTKLQISSMFDKEDFSLVLQNEELNKNYAKISNEKIIFENLVIVSDGYDFERRHQLLGKLPKNVGILAVNRAGVKWKLLNTETPPELRRTINAYVVNNPYKECMRYLPPRNQPYYPVCVSSTRTNHEFLKKYLGDVYTYTPSAENNFGVHRSENYCIDDYRNPICAAVGLAHQFKTKKLLMLCCDDSTENRRDESVQLANGLYTYPHHLKSQEIIDANLYWLTHQENAQIQVADYSSGKDYENAAYIRTEDGVFQFFSEGTSNGR